MRVCQTRGEYDTWMTAMLWRRFQVNRGIFMREGKRFGRTHTVKLVTLVR